MPDEHDRARGSAAPPGWAEAFAALPQEAPPGDGWSRVAARVPSRHRARWPAWLAIAAVLAVVAVLPSRLLSPDAPVPGQHAAAPDRQAATEPTPDETPAHYTIDAGDIASTAPRRNDEEATATRVPARVATGSEPPPAGATPARRPDASPAAAGAAATVATTGATATSPEADSADREMQRLQAESAQLEALLAMARDDRVASGTAVALASEYDAQVGAIDAALMQPGISADERASLWRDRVAALRQAAAFESTRRMLAAQGERYDTMLVSID